MRMRSKSEATLDITPYETDDMHLRALGARQLVAGAVLGVVLACCASMSLAPVDSSDVFALVKDATGAGYIVLEVLCGLPARDACLVPVALGALLARPCYRVFLAHGRHRRAAMPSPGFAAAWVLPMLFAATMAFGQSFDGCGSAEWITDGISQGVKGLLLGLGWFGFARIGLTYLFAALDRVRGRAGERETAGGACPPRPAEDASGARGAQPGEAARTADACACADDEGHATAAREASARTVSLPRRYVAAVCLRRVRRRLGARCARHPFAAPALALGLLWLPTLIGYAPGLVMWDTKTQLLQWFGMENHVSASMGLDPATAQTMVTQHHPPLHTALLGLCMQAGLYLAHSATAGAMLYSVLQYVVVVASLGYAFSTLRRLGVRPGARHAAFAVIAFVPVFSGYAVLMSKDVPFAAALLALLMALVRVLRGAAAHHDRALLVLSALAASELRSAAAVVVAAALAVACGAAWRQREAQAKERAQARSTASALGRSPLPLLAGTLAAVLALTMVLGSVVYPALGVLPSSTREMLSIPAQQVARYLRDNPDGITAEERRVIGAVFDVDQLGELYKPSKSDPVKNTFNNNASSADLARFFQAWAAIVARDPESAVTATAANYYGYLYPPHTVRWSYTSDFSQKVMENIDEVTSEPGSTVHLQIAQPDYPLVRICDTLVSMYRAVWQRLPGLTLCMQAALWCWLLAVATVYAARVRAGAAPLLVPLWLVLGMALVGPCNATTYFRYVYPIAVCLPFICALVLGAPNAARHGAPRPQAGSKA